MIIFLPGGLKFSACAPGFYHFNVFLYAVMRDSYYKIECFFVKIENFKFFQENVKSGMCCLCDAISVFSKFKGNSSTRGQPGRDFSFPDSITFDLRSEKIIIKFFLIQKEIFFSTSVTPASLANTHFLFALAFAYLFYPRFFFDISFRLT